MIEIVIVGGAVSFICFAIIALAAFLYASLSLVVALCVFVVAGFIAWLIAFLLRPKPYRDHYGEPFGDMPRGRRG